MPATTRERTTRASELIMKTNSNTCDILILAIEDSIVPIKAEITNITAR